MSALRLILLLVVAWLAVFAETTINLRSWLGAQPDLLPGLMVYASLSGGLPAVTATAVVGGLLFDSLSANPLGVSVLPLLACGLVIQRWRHLILRHQKHAQFLLGAGASAVAPVLTVLMLISLGHEPLVGWGSLWQLFVLSLVGGLVAPLWFLVFDRLDRAFAYQPVVETAFRENREIKYGRK